MKRLTLKEAWRLCVKGQWHWIQLRIKRGDKRKVGGLKVAWIDKHGFKDITADCFFCEYDDQKCASMRDWCNCCPAKKIDPDFHCRNSAYHFSLRPLDFYAKITELYKIYLKGAK